MKQNKEGKAVYYAIDNKPRLVFYTKMSIKSLRKFNNNIRVYLFIYGDLTNINLSFFHKKNVKIINKGAVKKGHVTSIKWFSLQGLLNFKVNRLIFCDADTVFFKNVDILFECFKEFDFYARKEIVSPLQMDYALLQQITEKYGAINLPIFNTGVMIFIGIS